MSTSVKSMLETVERVFQSAHTVVSGMQDGQRMQVKELAQTVSLSVGLEAKHVLPFVTHYLHNTDIAYVTRGKKGGIVKGVKPLKQDKLSKKNKSSTDSE